MKTLQSKVIVSDIVFPEGPRWHQGKLWFSDILDRKVRIYDPKTGAATAIVETDDRPSGLGFLPDGALLIATMGDCKLIRLAADGLKVAVGLRHLCEGLNDMVIDAQGRAYLDAHLPGGIGGLLMVTPQGEGRIVARDMTAPNGLAITPDGKTLIANDLMGNVILAFDIAADGSLANRRVFADLDGASPDGICLDAEGAAWVGLPFQRKFRRIKPGGEITHEIDCGEKWGIAPMLGGPDRRTLYLCTAEVSFEKIRELMQQGPAEARKECKGWIEVVERVDVPGAGWP